MVSLKTGKPSIFILLLIFITSDLLFLTPFSSPAHAAIQWSLSVVEGYYLPGLDELNYILKNSEVELGPRNTEARPSPYPVIYQGISPEMPEMSPKSPKMGLQLQADLNPSYAIVLGGSMAVFDSATRDIRPFFVGFSIPATRETRFSLSLNQFWLGAKRHWTFGDVASIIERVAGKEKEESKAPGSSYLVPPPRFYVEMGILAVTRAYLTTDVWLHVYAPDEGFDFYKVTETGARGTGYATYIGIGGEYFIRKWLSAGIDIDYTVGGVKDLRFDHFFTVDPLEKDIIKTGDKVLFSDLKRGKVTPLFIDLEGLGYKLQVRMYF